jgi:hypothetical protein
VADGGIVVEFAAVGSVEDDQDAGLLLAGILEIELVVAGADEIFRGKGLHGGVEGERTGISAAGERGEGKQDEREEGESGV